MKLSDLCGPVANLTPLDKGAQPANNYERQWQEEGFLILKQFIPLEIVDEYCKWRSKKSPQFDDTPSYVSDEATSLKDLCLYAPLMQIIKGLLGEEAAMQFNLLQWVSSERNWHMDTYLNSSQASVGSFYLAVWFALDTIDSNSGPFEFIPGSHRLFQPLNYDKVLSAMSRRKIGWSFKAPWPKESEKLLDELIEQEIKERNLPIRQFLGDTGDVLIWHSNLIHRGSKARVPGTLRKACITHYSGINHRTDCIDCKVHTSGGKYFIMNYPIRKNKISD